MARKKIDPAKAKEKKQKIIAAVGGVILVLLLAIQGPKLMKQLHHKTPAATAAATTSTPSSTGTASSTATATPAGASPTASAAGSAGPATLTSSDAAPAVGDGQLASFSLFASKDPFAQQIVPTQDCNPAGVQDACPTTSGTSSTGTGSSSGGSSSGGSTTVPAPGSAVISVNGTLMTVTVGGDFPQPTPADPSARQLFHLVSVAAHSAKISIVGGSYTSGAVTVTLRENRPVTLMNTSDGTRYKLILKPQGTSVPTSTTTTPTTTTTPAP